MYVIIVFETFKQNFKWLYTVGNKQTPKDDEISSFSENSKLFLNQLRNIGFGNEEFKDYEHILLSHAVDVLQV